MYNFFVTYAKLDEWTPDKSEFTINDLRFTKDDPAIVNGKSKIVNPLDRWILARLNDVLARVTQNFADYDAFRATISIQGLLDDLTNWYIRRSRRRFWRSEHDGDKDAAYATLYHVLVTTIKMLAPITPFVAETMYQNLVRGVDAVAPESVHHCAWPQADAAAIDPALIEQMDLTRRIASLGLSARESAN